MRNLSVTLKTTLPLSDDLFGYFDKNLWELNPVCVRWRDLPLETYYVWGSDADFLPSSTEEQKKDKMQELGRGISLKISERHYCLQGDRRIIMNQHTNNWVFPATLKPEREVLQHTYFDE